MRMISMCKSDIACHSSAYVWLDQANFVENTVIKSQMYDVHLFVFDRDLMYFRVRS